MKYRGYSEHASEAWWESPGFNISDLPHHEGIEGQDVKKVWALQTKAALLLNRYGFPVGYLISLCVSVYGG
jgi:hypothetical protein